MRQGVQCTGLSAAGGLTAGQKILVHGAPDLSAPAAVQLAACFGADVTAVCTSKNLEFADVRHRPGVKRAAECCAGYRDWWGAVGQCLPAVTGGAVRGAMGELRAGSRRSQSTLMIFHPAAVWIRCR